MPLPLPESEQRPEDLARLYQETFSLPRAKLDRRKHFVPSLEAKLVLARAPLLLLPRENPALASAANEGSSLLAAVPHRRASTHARKCSAGGRAHSAQAYAGHGHNLRIPSAVGCATPGDRAAVHS